MIDGIKPVDCTGCKMCADICPESAIAFHADEKGFWYPAVDGGKCIQCELCLKTCPSMAGYQSDQEDPEVYAAWAKDDAVRLRSTSGGIYYVLAKRYVSKGKYIAGCQYTEDWKGAFHAIANSEEELEKIMGSKYIQSDAGGIYKKIKSLLEENKEVLFCGTPCQSAALQNFLKKPYAKLVTVDFICKGINSPKVYEEYLTELEEKFNSKALSVHMKNKRKGWQSLGINIRFQNGREYFREGKEDLWVQGYVKENLYTRSSCHHCKYKTVPRVSDISLGDFWDAGGFDKSDLFKGISLVMINSMKGKELFGQIKEDILFENRSLDEAVKGNPSIFESVGEQGKSELFFQLRKTMKVSDAIKKCFEPQGSESEEHKQTLFMKVWSILTSVDLIKFIHYNFFCKAISREKGCYLMTYKNCIIDLAKSSKIHMKSGNIQLGASKLKGSKAETYLRMGENSSWISNGDAVLFYNTQVEVQKNATLETGYFSANCGTVIVCAKKITLGENVMLGRNVIIYDSDHHQIVDRNGQMINYDGEVTIGDHVWLTSGVTVTRGVTIGEGSIITPQSLVNKDLPPYALAGGSASANLVIINKNASWNRESTHQR